MVMENGSVYGGGIVEYQPRALTVARPANGVNVEVRLPDAQAECWLQGVKQGGSGMVRRYQSPELDPTKDYTYTVSAAWQENGQLVTQERQVARASEMSPSSWTSPSRSQRRSSGRIDGHTAAPGRAADDAIAVCRCAAVCPPRSKQCGRDLDQWACACSGKSPA